MKNGLESKDEPAEENEEFDGCCNRKRMKTLKKEWKSTKNVDEATTACHLLIWWQTMMRLGVSE